MFDESLWESTVTVWIIVGIYGKEKAVSGKSFVSIVNSTEASENDRQQPAAKLQW